MSNHILAINCPYFEHFVSIAKRLSLKPSIFWKDSNSDFFMIKEIYSEIVPNSFNFETVTKR